MEPHKKLQRISSPEKLEDIDSDEEQRRAVELVDFVNPVDRLQQSQTVITSKDTEAGGGLNLAIKWAKPNTAGPSSIPGPKTQEEVALKKSEKKTKGKKPDDKPEKSPKQIATAVDQSKEQWTSTLDTSNKDVQSGSTPKNKQKAKLKKIDSETRPEDILDILQNRKLAPTEWESFAAQLLKRGFKSLRTTSEDMSSQHPNGIRDLNLLMGFETILALKNRGSDEAQDRLRVKSQNSLGTRSNIPSRKYRRSCQGEHFSRPHSRSTDED